MERRGLLESPQILTDVELLVLRNLILPPKCLQPIVFKQFLHIWPLLWLFLDARLHELLCLLGGLTEFDPVRLTINHFLADSLP